jgi:O-antigen/teichoic acid export membrane protein
LVVFAVIPVSFHFLVLCQVIGLACATIYLYAATWPEWRGCWYRRVSGNRLKPLLRFALPVQISNALFWALTATNVLVLRYFSSLEQVGIYATAVGIAGLGMVLRSMFTVIWIPLVYKWDAQGDALTRVKAVLGPVSCLACLLVCLGGALSGLALWILPERLWDARHLLAVCLIPPVLYTLSEITVVGIPLTRKTQFAVYASGGAALVNICACLMLVPPYGAAGAAIANALCFFVFFALRSAFSGYVWRRLPMTRTYIAVAVIAAGASIHAVSSIENPIVWGTYWVSLGAISLALFSKELSGIGSCLKYLRANV